jgi:hypothetical protein
MILKNMNFLAEGPAWPARNNGLITEAGRQTGLPPAKLSGKSDGYLAKGAKVSRNMAAGRAFDRPDETARQHDIPR